VADLSRIYILEERRYSLNGDMLQIVVNDEAGSPLKLVNGLADFQAVAVFQDFTQQNSLGPADIWSDLRSIQIELRGSVAGGDGTIERTWSNEIMPRNILSQ
jgi:hypothetical protein